MKKKIEIKKIEHTDWNKEHAAYIKNYSLPTNTPFYAAKFFSPTKIWGQLWLPDNAKGLVHLIHGMSEHTANYSQFIQELLHMNYAVSATDLQGFGRSGGKKGHTKDTYSYAQDIEQWLEMLYTSLDSSLPLFFWGHSLGGQICLQLLLRNKIPQKPNAICLSNPFLGFPDTNILNRFLLYLTPLLDKIIPSLTLPVIRLNSYISDNKDYIKRRKADPMISYSRISPHWVMCRLKALEDIKKQYAYFSEAPPILHMIAAKDLIINVNANRQFGRSALCFPQHRNIEFENMSHEMEKGNERYKVVQETEAWLKKHS